MQTPAPGLISNSVYLKGNKTIFYSSHYTFFRKYLQSDVSKDHVVFVNMPLNQACGLNDLLVKINGQVTQSATVLFISQTAESIRNNILSSYKQPLRHLIYILHFLYHRAFPKFSAVTGHIYRRINKGRANVLHSSEILGRIAGHGFAIQEYCFEKNMLLVAAKKILPAPQTVNGARGLIFCMPRIGKNGKLIKVYKLRTMHPYAEYLQEFILRRNGLDDDGKFKNDFRITGWGKVLRKYWIDELPMLINLVKGDIKLVGVRPLTTKYFELYPDDVKALRLKTKPGFIPPSYAFSAGSLEDIICLEKKYLQEHQERPVTTDIKYLFRIVSNLMLRKIKSK